MASWCWDVGGTGSGGHPCQVQHTGTDILQYEQPCGVKCVVTEHWRQVCPANVALQPPVQKRMKRARDKD